MKKLIVHIGYPKTATTSIQQNFFTKLMKDDKIEYLNHLNRSDEFLGEIYCGNIISYITSQNYDKAQLENEIINIQRIKKKIAVISNENISFFSKNFNWAYQNGQAINNVKRIYEVFDGIFDVIEILIGIRAQKTLIPSFYKQQYYLIINENPSFKNYNKWLDANFGRHINEENLFLNYEQIFREYSNIFGRENVYLLVFEDLKNDVNSYVNTLSKVLEVDEKIVKNLLSHMPKNVTKTDKRGNILSSKPKIGQLLTLPFKNRVKNYLSKKQFEKVKEVYKMILPESIRKIEIPTSKKLNVILLENIDEVVQRFYDSNVNLMKVANLDEKKMIKYGYYE